MTDYKALVEELQAACLTGYEQDCTQRAKPIERKCRNCKAADAIKRLAADLDMTTQRMEWTVNDNAQKAIALADTRARAERYKAALEGARGIFEAGNVHAAYVIIHHALQETDDGEL